MMKEKNGFISISVVYSFFVVFMLLLIIIINSYVNNRVSFDIYKDYIKQKTVEKYVVTNGNTIKLNDMIKDKAISIVPSWDEQKWYIKQEGKDYYFRGSIPPNFVCLSTNEKDNCQENTNSLYRIVGIFYADSRLTENSKLKDKYLVKLVKFYPYKAVEYSNIDHELEGYIEGADAFGNKLFDEKTKSLVVKVKHTSFKPNSASVKFNTMLNGENTNRNTVESWAGLLTVGDIGYTIGDFGPTAACQPGSLNADNLSIKSNGENTWCKSYGWNISEQWLYNQSNPDNNRFKIDEKGNIVINTENEVLNIRPVIYLDPDAVILGGNGEQGSPYMLNIYAGEDTSE